MKLSKIVIAFVVVFICFATPSTLLGGTEEELAAQLEQQEEELAKRLTNPIAALINVPFQFNYDQNFGPDDDGDRWWINIQPVAPIDLSRDWNLISRTILPVVFQDDIFPGSGSQAGISDLVQSFFFSPKAPTPSGWIWGAGPVMLFPTGSDDLLTTDKWGAGPTAVALKQRGQWTYGFLANHIWSYAGNDNRADVNQSFLQPWVSYVTPTAWTFTLMTESTYEWQNEQWTVPLIGMVSKMTNIKGQMMSFGAGLRYWVDTPDSGPEGFGLRFVCALLFPK